MYDLIVIVLLVDFVRCTRLLFGGSRCMLSVRLGRCNIAFEYIIITMLYKLLSPLLIKMACPLSPVVISHSPQ